MAEAFRADARVPVKDIEHFIYCLKSREWGDMRTFTNVGQHSHETPETEKPRHPEG